MDVIIALVLISLTLVFAGLIFFFTRLFDGDFEHGDRLSLLPLADDTGEEKPDSKKDNDNQDKIDSNAQGQSAE